MGKAVLGSSYTFAVGNGLTLLGEYHYSTFGIEDVADAVARLADVDLRRRFLRGDTQTLSRHALGAQLSYPIDDALTGSVTLLLSACDGSGLVMPALNWDASDHVRVSLSAHLPWGAVPSGGRLRSEYGASPASLFAQVSISF